MADFKFEEGQRVVLTQDQSYIDAFSTGQILSRIDVFGLPEYLVQFDDSEYSDVAAWFIKEKDLVAE